ncbi:cytoskeleton protein RodZ [Volucribacter psittacicida]|uniref:Cytoskeleton protein RodZ n=1 Tax=Volucribacter psittacicida TaxID=203482 RepID=A0A4V2PCJ0_9PAST|nr:RodZ family helix-turn-helix domain-containing protein [Volucribacter psittacicida]TCK01456.1 cytoskeleton protein RodZ [Volucribacter psittacicida]
MQNKPDFAEPNTPSLGDQFRLAREALGLSLTEAAEKVGLRLSILQHIENNEFIHSAIPATFMRGYVRNYAKFLKLPENLYQQIQFGEIEKNDLNKNARAKKVVNSHSGHGRWLSCLTWFVVIAVIGMTLLWWWENHQQANAERDNLVDNYVVNHSESVQSHALPVSLTATEEKPRAEQAENVPSTENAPVSSDNLTQTTTSDVMNAATSSDNTSVVAQHIHNISTPATADTEQTQQPILHIEVTQASCWISVRNANGKILAEKEYKQGEVLHFNDGEPYSLIIGAPNNVKITYRGQNVPLKVDGRVARFRLPES